MRPIDAPKKALLNSNEAAGWMGMGKDLFEQTADAENWMHPVWCGTGRRKVKKWHWMDVVCLLHIMHCRGTKLEESNSENSSDEAG